MIELSSDFVMVPLDFKHALTYGEYNLRHCETRFFQMELTKADRDPVDRREC